MTNSIKRGRLIATAVIALGLLITGCDRIDRNYHKYIMRGQVLDVRGGEIDICIGARDGARIGQVFEVYIITGRVKGFNPGGVPEYKREKTGSIRITAIYNEHYAKALVVSGKVEKNSIAEIEINE